MRARNSLNSKGRNTSSKCVNGMCSADFCVMATILVIDDDAHVRMAVEQSLKNAGHIVLSASDGKEGVNQVQKHIVQLVVTDLFMEGQEGVETIAALRKKHPQLSIIAMSGGNPASETMLAVAKQLGARQVLSKPFSAKSLVDAVERVLNGGPKED